MEENKKRLPTYGELEDEIDRLNSQVKELEKIIQRKNKYIGRLEYSERLMTRYIEEHEVWSNYEHWKEQEERENPYYEPEDSNNESSETD